MCKNLADTEIHIFEDNISMVVLLHVYIQSCNKFREKIVLEKVYVTISDQLCLSIQYFASIISISAKSHISAPLQKAGNQGSREIAYILADTL